MNGTLGKPQGFPKHGTNHLVPNIRGFIWTPYYNSRKFAGISPLGLLTTRAEIGDRTISVCVGLARMPTDGKPFIRVISVNESVDGKANPSGIALEGDCFHPLDSHSKGVILRHASKDDVNMFEEHVFIIKTILDGLELFGARKGATVNYEKMVLAMQEGLFDNLLSASLKGDATNDLKRWDLDNVQSVANFDIEIGLGVPPREYHRPTTELYGVQVQPHEPVGLAEVTAVHLTHMMNHMGFIHYHLGKGDVQSCLERALSCMKVQFTESASKQTLFTYDPGEAHWKRSAIGGTDFDLAYRPSHDLGERILRGKNKGKDLYRFGSLMWGAEKVHHSRWGTVHGEMFRVFYYRDGSVDNEFAFADSDNYPHG